MQQQTQYVSWYEKFRPKTIDELIFPDTLNGEKKDPQYIKDIMKTFYDNEFIQGNILSYGKAGFGKTSLNKIFQGKIIKHPRDIFILDRKIASVDELQIWLNQSKNKSNQKLVIIEEIDRLSPQAQAVLKDGSLEKYQNKVSFLATTNNAQKLDPALITRFNYRMYFDTIDEEQTISRMAWILNSEKITYNHTDLVNFVKVNIKRGLRELISNLEINSVTGTFVFDVNKALNISGNESYVVDVFKYLLQLLRSYSAEHLEKLMVNIRSDENFSTYYIYLTEVLKKDLLLNYDYIYDQLIQEESIDFGTRNILIKDYQDIEMVKMKNFQFLHTISSMIYEVYRMKTLKSPTEIIEEKPINLG